MEPGIAVPGNHIQLPGHFTVIQTIIELSLIHILEWYDGFTFGNKKDIYNPWSIINFLKSGKVGTYWANTSANSLVGKLIREGSRDIKLSFEQLLQGKTIRTSINEQIVFNQLNQDENAIWSLLLASGYLKVVSYKAANPEKDDWQQE